MWLAIVLACSTPMANSCVLFAKNEQMFYTYNDCEVETKKMLAILHQKRIYGVPSCIKIGTNLQENKMKKLLLASAIAVVATSAHAIDLGYGLSLGAETDLNYTTGTETWEMDFTPSMALGAYGVSFSAETTIDVLDINNGDIFEGIDWKAEYAWNGVTTYTEVSSDADFEFGDITIGAKLKF